MMKKFVVALLAIVLVAGLASCKKKNQTDDDSNKYLENDVIITYLRQESKTASGDVQKDASGNVLYDTFHFEDVDSDSVRLVRYECEIVGSELTREDGTKAVSYLKSYVPHDVVIPSKFGEKTVVEIAQSCFHGLSGVTAITLPNTLETIGNFAFSECRQIADLVIPASVTAIGDSAFRGCISLKSVDLSAATGLETISANTFWGCAALEKVTIPGSVKTVKSGAFFNCTGMTELTIAEGVETVESQVFQGLSSLSKLSLPASLKTIGDLNFYGCTVLYSDYVTFPAENTVVADFVASLKLLTEAEAAAATAEPESTAEPETTTEPETT